MKTDLLASFTVALLCSSGLTTKVNGQGLETEPNDAYQQASRLVMGTMTDTLFATISSMSDVDWYAVDLDSTRMYYIASFNAVADINVELFFQENLNASVLRGSVYHRGGGNNFRIAGYVPARTGKYYLRVFGMSGSTGNYALRITGGRNVIDIRSIHEPDDNVIQAANQGSLEMNGSAMAALYPADDVDYYAFRGRAGQAYKIFSFPLPDMGIRDCDTYIDLLDSTGVRRLKSNDDIGIDPITGFNNVFSQIQGRLPYTGTYFLAVRDFYNSRFTNEPLNDTNPPTGEYGVTLEMDTSFVKRYPYVQMPTTTSVLIAWKTTEPTTSRVEYGIDQGYSAFVQDTAKVTDHAVTITGLAPNTIYYYRVKTNDKLITAGDTLTFHTNNDRTHTRYSFWVFGDTGDGSLSQFAVADRIQATRPLYDFGLHTGDVIYPRGEPWDFDPKYFVPYQRLIRNTCMFMSPGNHDYYFDQVIGAGYYDAFYLPHNNPDSTEHYYSFDYGNAHFISLDIGPDAIPVTYDPSSAQYKWLESDLQSPQAETATWRFVFFHKPPYTEGWDSPGYDGEIPMRTILLPLFEKYKVDIVFNGHTHGYERGFLNGVYYIITGGGGNRNLDYFIQDWPHITFHKYVHHFVDVSVDDTVLKLRAIDKSGAVFDSLTIDKSATTIGDSQSDESVPRDFALAQNYPNPFNSGTTLRYELPGPGKVVLRVYDVLGRAVKTLVDDYQGSGRYTVQFDGQNSGNSTPLASGVYFYQLRVHRGSMVIYSKANKMLLIR